MDQHRPFGPYAHRCAGRRDFGAARWPLSRINDSGEVRGFVLSRLEDMLGRAVPSDAEHRIFVDQNARHLVFDPTNLRLSSTRRRARRRRRYYTTPTREPPRGSRSGFLAAGTAPGPALGGRVDGTLRSQAPFRALACPPSIPQQRHMTFLASEICRYFLGGSEEHRRGKCSNPSPAARGPGHGYRQVA